MEACQQIPPHFIDRGTFQTFGQISTRSLEWPSIWLHTFSHYTKHVTLPKWSNIFIKISQLLSFHVMYIISLKTVNIRKIHINKEKKRWNPRMLWPIATHTQQYCLYTYWESVLSFLLKWHLQLTKFKSTESHTPLGFFRSLFRFRYWLFGDNLLGSRKKPKIVYL